MVNDPDHVILEDPVNHLPGLLAGIWPVSVVSVVYLTRRLNGQAVDRIWDEKVSQSTRPAPIAVELIREGFLEAPDRCVGE